MNYAISWHTINWIHDACRANWVSLHLYGGNVPKWICHQRTCSGMVNPICLRQESSLPAAQRATAKALVWVGRENKSNIMQHPKWHSLYCSPIVLPRWAWEEINKSQILPSRKDEQLDLNLELSINHQPKVVLAAQDENILAPHSHALRPAILTDPDAKSIKVLCPVISNSSWKT